MKSESFIRVLLIVCKWKDTGGVMSIVEHTGIDVEKHRFQNQAKAYSKYTIHWVLFFVHVVATAHGCRKKRLLIGRSDMQRIKISKLHIQLVRKEVVGRNLPQASTASTNRVYERTPKVRRLLNHDFGCWNVISFILVTLYLWVMLYHQFVVSFDNNSLMQRRLLTLKLLSLCESYVTYKIASFFSRTLYASIFAVVYVCVYFVVVILC